MKRRSTLLLAVLMGLAIIVPMGAAKLAFATGDHYYNFESSLGGWTLGADPGVLNPSITRTNESNYCPSNGSWSAKLQGDDFENGRGAVWMQHTYSDSGPVSVTINWRAINSIAGTGTLSRVYVGSRPPTDGSSFTTVDTIYGSWTPYTYTTSTAWLK
jgi:hypothetical protein